MLYYFLAFVSGNLTVTVESLVDSLKRRDNLLPMQAATEKRKRPCGRVGLCGLSQWKENVRVDELACVGHGRGYLQNVRVNE